MPCRPPQLILIWFLKNLQWYTRSSVNTAVHFFADLILYRMDIRFYVRDIWKERGKEELGHNIPASADIVWIQIPEPLGKIFFKEEKISFSRQLLVAMTYILF